MTTAEFLSPDLIPGARQLWKNSFGDDDAFLDTFFGTAFAPERSLCIREGSQVLAALYWFDVSCDGYPFAYVYAVATDPAHRGKGLCRRLMAHTRAHLTKLGYAGILLVPQEEGLIQMYAGMDYLPCTSVTEFRCESDGPAVSLIPLTRAEYARRRRELLPPGGVIQEGENLAFLETMADFYEGPGFLAAVSITDGTLHCPELLGDCVAAPGILKALGCDHGFFRCPGSSKPFSMFCPLTADCPTPGYFGLAFD